MMWRAAYRTASRKRCVCVIGEVSGDLQSHGDDWRSMNEGFWYRLIKCHRMNRVITHLCDLRLLRLRLCLVTPLGPRPFLHVTDGIAVLKHVEFTGQLLDDILLL